jgi:hypothetical protein
VEELSEPVLSRPISITHLRHSPCLESLNDLAWLPDLDGVALVEAWSTTDKNCLREPVKSRSTTAIS